MVMVWAVRCGEEMWYLEGVQCCRVDIVWRALRLSRTMPRW